MNVTHHDGVDERALDALGISAQEERVYRWLLMHSEATLAEVAQSQQLAPRRAQRLLDAIEAKGLVTYSPQRVRSYIAAAPDIAMEALAMRRQDDLQRARGLIRELQEQAAQRQVRREQQVELLTSREAERQAFEHMQSTAQHEVVTLVRPPILISRLEQPSEDDQRTQRDAQARGVRYRSIVDAEYLQIPGAVARMRAEVDSGEEIRVVSHLPFKMALADRRIAFIPLQLEQSGTPSLLVRSSALVDALHALFEILWERAGPVGFSRSGAVYMTDAAPDLQAASQELIALMSAGLNDKAIAHELAISASTLNRRIAEMMKAADARTRFQLGWLAALRQVREDAAG